MKLKAIYIFLCGILLSACTSEDFKDKESNFPHTGNSAFESELSPDFLAAKKLSSATSKLSETTTYYVYASRLNVRIEPNVNAPVAMVLNMNDEVKLVSGEVINGFVEIAEYKSAASVKPEYESAALFLSYEYLSQEKNESKYTSNAHKYFMIQNLASETLRVYEKMCDDGNCEHRMVLETDAAVGEKGGKESAVGFYHISSWHKFYQDGAGNYPSWYHPSYPLPPKPGVSAVTWTNSKYLPYKGASVRGAFGWYTAKISPNSYYQWTHGTIGWGKDKDKYIKATRGFWANVFADPRSSGCTRTDNESIAYIRELLEVGTPIIKVYAREAYEDESLSNYSEHKETWDYILTTNGSQRDGQKADFHSVIAAGTPSSQYLETGTYKIDAYPEAKPFLSGSGGAKSGRSANVYGLDHKDMVGVFLVDSGKLLNYSHPRKMILGGYKDQLLPDFAIAKDYGLTIALPDCPRNSKSRCAKEISFYRP